MLEKALNQIPQKDTEPIFLTNQDKELLATIIRSYADSKDVKELIYPELRVKKLIQLTSKLVNIIHIDTDIIDELNNKLI